MCEPPKRCLPMCLVSALSLPQVVGSIRWTVEVGSFLPKGAEAGYFAFGGSTVVLLFQAGAVAWDADLVENRCVGGLGGACNWPACTRDGKRCITGLRRHAVQRFRWPTAAVFPPLPFPPCRSLNSLETRVLMGERLGRQASAEGQHKDGGAEAADA